MILVIQNGRVVATHGNDQADYITPELYPNCEIKTWSGPMPEIGAGDPTLS